MASLKYDESLKFTLSKKHTRALEEIEYNHDFSSQSEAVRFCIQFTYTLIKKGLMVGALNALMEDMMCEELEDEGA